MRNYGPIDLPGLLFLLTGDPARNKTTAYILRADEAINIRPHPKQAGHCVMCMAGDAPVITLVAMRQIRLVELAERRLLTHRTKIVWLCEKPGVDEFPDWIWLKAKGIDVQYPERCTPTPPLLNMWMDKSGEMQVELTRG